jgi:hypothetical protein
MIFPYFLVQTISESPHFPGAHVVATDLEELPLQLLKVRFFAMDFKNFGERKILSGNLT